MNIVRSMLPGSLRPEHFLKVPATGPSSSGAAAFVPAWKITEDNLAVDAQSLADFAEHVIPPAVADKLGALSAVDAKRARLLLSFWNFAAQCDEQARTERLTEHWRMNSVVISRQEAEIAALKDRVLMQGEELKVANEAKMKAEADLKAEQLRRAESVAALAPLQERVKVLEAEGAELVRKDEQLQSRFVDLTSDLERARKEISGLEEACTLNMKDFNKAKSESMDLANDLGRLQRGIPDLVKRALASDSVTTPFKEFLSAVQEVEVLNTVNLFVETFPDLPTPLPDAIESKINPDCYDRADRAGEALKALSIPNLDRIGVETGLSVDDILGMQL